MNDILFAFVMCGGYADGALTIDAKRFFALNTVKRHKKTGLMIEGFKKFGFAIDGYNKRAGAFTVRSPESPHVITALFAYAGQIDANMKDRAYGTPFAGFSYRFVEDPAVQEYETSVLADMDYCSEKLREIKRFLHAEAGKCGFAVDNKRIWQFSYKKGSKEFLRVWIEDAIGLMTMRGDMTGFTYRIGLFFPAETNVPDGYDFIDLPESDIGAGWVCGSDENGEIYGAPPHEAVCKKLEENGIETFRNDIAGKDSDTYCFFERYNCPRFIEKDANGNVTLDYGNYIMSDTNGTKIEDAIN